MQRGVDSDGGHQHRKNKRAQRKKSAVKLKVPPQGGGIARAGGYLEHSTHPLEVPCQSLLKGGGVEPFCTNPPREIDVPTQTAAPPPPNKHSGVGPNIPTEMTLGTKMKTVFLELAQGGDSEKFPFA